MKKYQQGLTLVELMIALLIGLILTLAAVQVFLTNQRTFALQQAISELNNDGQLAMRFMVSRVRHAGLGDTEAIPPVATTKIDDKPLDNNTLVVQAWGEGGCFGAFDEGVITTQFSLNNNILQCQDSVENKPYELLQGVEAFNILYGIDEVKDGVLGVTRYVTADALNKNSIIVAIRFSFLLSGMEITSSNASESSDWVLNQEVKKNDRRIRRVYSTTVQVRNFNWGGV